MHISLRALLLATCTDGALRRVSRRGCADVCAGWFLLIGASTLLVYQHHVIDLLGGYRGGTDLPSGDPGRMLHPRVHQRRSPCTPSPPPLLAHAGQNPHRQQRALDRLRTRHPTARVLRQPHQPSRCASCSGPRCTTEDSARWPGPSPRAITGPPIRLRRHLATRVFHAVLIDRHRVSAHARNPIEPLLDALENGDRRHSLILFPGGHAWHRSRKPGPFKSGLYHLARHRPDVELVPVLIDNMNRILPKGELLPVPMLGGLSFGKPLRVEEGEGEGGVPRPRAAAPSMTCGDRS